MPELSFQVESAEPVQFAASPMLHFKLRLADSSDEAIHTIVLNCQILAGAGLRPALSKPGEQERLGDLFRAACPMGRKTLKPMLWTHTSVIVPPFTKETTVNLPVPCSYDFNLAASKYFHALDDGEIPLLLLFSGSIFYATDGEHLQVTQIPWDKEAHYRLPVKIWKQMMDIYYPNTAWLCLQKDVFDQLYQYKREHGLPTWERAIEKLLDGCGRKSAHMRSRSSSTNSRIRAWLYEGYVLYPYRPSVKNPAAMDFRRDLSRAIGASGAQNGAEPCLMQTECLFEGQSATLRVIARFLHLIDRTVGESTDGQTFRLVDSLEFEGRLYRPWQERRRSGKSIWVNLKIAELIKGVQKSFSFPANSDREILHSADGQIVGIIERRQQSIEMSVELSATGLDERIFQIDGKRFSIAPPCPMQRVHRVIGQLAFLACFNAYNSWHRFGGVYFVDRSARCLPRACFFVQEYWLCVARGLVGREPQRDTILSSPIILSDYPELAAGESGRSV